VEDNTDRPDRAPAAAPESTSAPEGDDDDATVTDDPDDRTDPAAAASGTGAPPSSSPPDEVSEDTEDNNEPDDSGFFDRAGDFFGGLARDVQDFARENPRVDSYGNPVGLIDADGIQRGEVASGVMSSGTNPKDLANQLGFSSTQEMAAAQNTDFIESKYQEDLAQRRAIEEAIGERYGFHPEVVRGLGPPLSAQPPLEDLAIIEAMQGLPPDKVLEAIEQAKELMPELPPDVWEKTEAVMKGALDGSVKMLGVAAAISQTDSPLPGPADLVAVATVIAGGIAGGVDAYQAYEESRATIYEPNAPHIFRDAPGHVADTPENRTLIESTASNSDNFLGNDEFGNDWYARELDDGRQSWASVRNGEIRNGGINETPRNFDDETGLSRPSPNLD
jgi:hypothetical protein